MIREWCRIHVLGITVLDEANYYVPNVNRIMSEFVVHVKVDLRDAIPNFLVFKHRHV